MDRTPRVAVIILNWNGSALLERFLPSVVANTPAPLAEVIVADNGSTDDSLDLLRRRFPTVRVLPFETNHGFAEGYNLAIEAIDTEYTLLLNSDVRVTPGWLEPLVDFLDANPEYAACQPKILSERDHTQFEYAGASGGYLDRNGYPYCRGRIFSVVEEDCGQYDSPADIHWASGAALLVRRAAYLQAGGLDSRFFAHMEEIDLAWRLRLLGYKLAAIPASTVYHVGGASLAAGDPRKTYLNFRNSLLMLHKNLPDTCRRRLLLRRRLLDTLAWAKFVASLDFSNAAAILKAHRDFRHMRAHFTPVNTSGDNLLSGAPDIITDFYLRHRRKFSQLTLCHRGC